MNYKYLIAAIVIAFIAAVAPFGARSASAASIYDNAYKTTNELKLRGAPNSNVEIDITNNYSGLLNFQVPPSQLETPGIRYFYNNNEVANWYGNGTLNILNQNDYDIIKGRLDNMHNWSVSQRDNDISQGGTSNVEFSSSTSPSSLNWFDYGANCVQFMGATDRMNANISASASGIAVNFDSSTVQRIISCDDSDNYAMADFKNLLTFVDNQNLPSGYEGEPIREEYIPIDKKRIVPLTTWSYDGNTYLYASSLLDESICILQMTGTCTYMSQTTPIKYTLENTTTAEVVKEEELPAFKRFEYNEMVLGDEYKLSAKINFSVPIPGSPVNPDATEFVTIVFDINTSEGAQNGSPFTTDCSDNGSNYECEAPKLFKECYKDAFPFVDLPACIYNAQKIVSMLSFDRISLLPGNHSTASCKQLDTLGSWISADGVVVCPKVPVMVRDVVTPFVTIALTLMIALFIAKIGRGGN